MCDYENREAAMVILDPGTPEHHGRDGVWCDPCLAPLVKALNDGGLPTVASCCGHTKAAGSILLADGRALVIADHETLHLLMVGRERPVYHWAPRDRRDAIARDGLRPCSDPVNNGQPMPRISFGITPSAAWGLSGESWRAGEWDLWQAYIAGDVKPEENGEYRSGEPVAAWFVATRVAPPTE